MSVSANLETVRAAIRRAEAAGGRPEGEVRLVAVSKTHGAEIVREALDAGQRIFGENRVQEAQGKWPELQAACADIELHLIGPLQSNKAAAAVALFDVIETVDREKIAREIAKEMAAQQKSLQLFVQVNTGGEAQKAGIAPEDTRPFLALCRDELGLTISGLMCIPPVDENPGPHFALLKKLADENGLARVSMGMSGDYETAIALGATDVRVGSAIFGARDYSG